MAAFAILSLFYQDHNRKSTFENNCASNEMVFRLFSFHFCRHFVLDGSTSSMMSMSVSELKKIVGKTFDLIREKKPMIHHITNYVVMNLTANATIHIGGSPVMANAVEEVEEMVTLASALVINAGTLSVPWVTAMNRAGERANEKGIPIILDPVGVGATSYRTEAISKLFDSLNITIVKGNSAEIGKLNNERVEVRGVDSITGAADPRQTVYELAKKRKGKTIVALSGQIDYVCDGNQVVLVKNQSERLGQLTGMGCTVSALMACFAGVTDNYLVAAVGGFAVMGVCAELADQNISGAASFQVALFDHFSKLTGSVLEQRMNIDIVDCCE